MITDSKRLFDVIICLSSTREKQLLIDLVVLRDAYESFEMFRIGHTLSQNSSSDAFMKVKFSTAIKKVLDTGTLDLAVDEWVV